MKVNQEKYIQLLEQQVDQLVMELDDAISFMETFDDAETKYRVERKRALLESLANLPDNVKEEI